MSKITGLRPRKSRQKRIGVYLDGRFAFTVGAAMLAGERLKLGQELDEERIDALVKKDELQRCLDAAESYLGYRPRSESELRERLGRRGFAEYTIGNVIERLKSRGLVDDAAFARFWAENRESFRPRSRRLMRLELKRKGVDEGVISQATGAMDDAASAYRLALSRARGVPTDDFTVFRRRLGDYLRRRGFDYETIEKAIKRVWDELGGRA